MIYLIYQVSHKHKKSILPNLLSTSAGMMKMTSEGLFFTKRSSVILVAVPLKAKLPLRERLPSAVEVTQITFVPAMFTNV